MDRQVRNTIPFISKPQCFDGNRWAHYKIHFTACVAANRWSADESVSILSAKLTGEAALVLTQKQLKRDRDKVRQCRRTLMFEPNRNTFRRSGAMVLCRFTM